MLDILLLPLAILLAVISLWLQYLDFRVRYLESRVDLLYSMCVFCHHSVKLHIKGRCQLCDCTQSEVIV